MSSQSRFKGCGIFFATVIGACVLLVFLLVFLTLLGLRTAADISQGANAPNGEQVTDERAPTPSDYTVRAGDTLAKIAADHGTTVGSLMEANGLTNPDVIEVGQRLLLAEDSTRTVPKTRTPTPRRPATKPSSWQTITFTDEWGEPAGKGAVSRWTVPDRAMSFPYGRTQARLMVGSRCRPFIRFTELPNLVGGYAGVHHLPARWNDGESFTAEVRHTPGSKDLNFSSGHIYLYELVENQTLGVALNWYRQDGYVSWRFSLDGASKALSNIGCR